MIPNRLALSSHPALRAGALPWALGVWMALNGCDSTPAPERDAGAVTEDAGTPTVDAGAAVPEAGAADPDAGSAVDAGPPACPPSTEGNETNSGGECAFNAECPASERCECTDGTCVCAAGPRGTGCAGIDPCTDGNDCTSSVCAEGNGGAFYCSGVCAVDADCGPQLPRCLDVAFVGRICVREPATT